MDLLLWMKYSGQLSVSAKAVLNEVLRMGEIMEKMFKTGVRSWTLIFS